MAVTAMWGFEAQQAATDNTSLLGTSSYSTSTFRTGAASIRCNPASSASGLFVLVGLATQWVHFAINIASLPSVQRAFGAGEVGANYRLDAAGTISAYDSTTLLGTSSTALGTGAWYWVGVRLSAGSGVPLLQINGVTEVTGTTTNSGNGNGWGFPGSEASAVDAYFDDVIFDGAGFVGPSKVDIALPISDNTRTAVTDANGATTNLWQGVDNTPPAGVASASEAANPKASIKYPASLTEDYIANLETYTTLGIVSADTVLAVQSIVRHGEDIATGTKNLQNVGALTNPTVAGASVVAGSDGGAHGAESGANFWVTAFGTLTTSPSVTVGTSPTIRASRVSQSRVACIDFMAMLVAWTPAAAAGVPKSSTYPQLLPQ